MTAPEIEITEDWLRVFQRLSAAPGVVLIIGAPDTGKSTMAYFLALQSVKAGMRTAYLDGDLGQSVLGPPTTLSMVLLAEPPGDIHGLTWSYLYFIGSTSPAGHLLATATGIRRLAAKAADAGADMTVVDTSGLVAGEMGFELKFCKIELLSPRHIIAIQKEAELEHILRGFRRRKGMEIHYLSPHHRILPRSPEVRRAYREQRFQEYFRPSVRSSIPVDAVEVIHPGLPLVHSEGLSEQLQGTVVGLNDEEYFTRGLGIWVGLDRDTNEVSLLTPLNDLSDVRYLHLGHISLTISP